MAFIINSFGLFLDLKLYCLVGKGTFTLVFTLELS